ncbi:MAG: hypothetical protein ACRD0W_00465 [Acidimicrobiales bacterium]
MTIALTYLTDLSRVRIELSSIAEDVVSIERSANATGPWSTVRGAVTVDIVTGGAIVDDYEFYADVENFYQVIEVEPTPGTVLETDSITPDLAGATWLKSIKYPALNRAIPTPDYRPIQRAARSGVYNIKGKVDPIAAHDAWTSRWWTMETVTESLVAARDMDLVLAAGGTFFVHVPAETENECFTNPVSGMPGGYVLIVNSTQIHMVGGSHGMGWTLPVRVVEPPGPEIAGTTITWEGARRLYGSWEALWASNPTWRDLWGQIMDPEDAIQF